MTQVGRVITQLHLHPEGVCQVDFLAPNVIDGGKPITRLAARIYDARGLGYDIFEDGTRHGCAVYKLNTSAVLPAPVPPAPASYPAAARPADSLLLTHPRPGTGADKTAEQAPGSVHAEQATNDSNPGACDGQLFETPPPSPYHQDAA